MIQVPILYKNTHPRDGGKVMGIFTITDEKMSEYIHEKLKVDANATEVNIYCVSIDGDLDITFSFQSYHKG